MFTAALKTSKLSHSIEVNYHNILGPLSYWPQPFCIERVSQPILGPLSTPSVLVTGLSAAACPVALWT